ncbi:MAG: DUF3822 family protein [Paludibacter sp.]
MKDKPIIRSNQLIIKIDAEGFSLSVFDKPNHLLSGKRIEIDIFNLEREELHDLLKSETDLNTDKVEVIVESYQYCIIPLDIFRLEDAVDFLLFEHKPTQTDSILYNKIPDFGIVNVFAIPNSVLDVVNKLFPNSAIEHHISRFITDNISLQHENCIYCNTKNKKFDAVVIKNSRLTLINSFEYKTPEDFLYFVLNLYDKLSLNQQKHPVYLLNNINNQNVEKLLKTYLTTILL